MQTEAVALKLALAVLFTGCAVGRSGIAIEPPSARNPAQGPLVRIAKVTDARVFEHSPKESDAPYVANQTVAERAIARQRVGFGMSKALVDVVLGAGQNVPGLVREVLVAAFQRAGYRISEDPKATPVEATVERFWVWYDPGELTGRIKSEMAVSLKSELPAVKVLKGPILAKYEMPTSIITDSLWRTVVERMLEDFTVSARVKLQAQPLALH